MLFTILRKSLGSFKKIRLIDLEIRTLGFARDARTLPLSYAAPTKASVKESGPSKSLIRVHKNLKGLLVVVRSINWMTFRKKLKLSFPVKNLDCNKIDWISLLHHGHSFLLQKASKLSFSDLSNKNIL